MFNIDMPPEPQGWTWTICKPTDMRYDSYQLAMPSGRRMALQVETPLTAADRAWLHKLVDLILLGDDTSQPTETKT